MMDWNWWLIAGIGLAIVELLTVDLFFLMLGLSALAAAGVAALGAPLWLEVVTFAIAALLLLFVVRPWARNFLLHRTPNVRTNAQGLIGQQAVVRSSVTAHAGRVFLAGSEWSARTADTAEIPTDTTVTVIAIDGATAVVTAQS